jgi:hypothetical protein
MRSFVPIAKGLVKRPLYAVERQFYLSGVLPRRRLTLPHFLGLGPGQAGTTWLHYNLSRHPDVFMPHKKELHYFTRKFHRRPLSWYSSVFSQGRDKIRGEICPGYNVLLQERIRFIAKIMPDVRLFLIVRNPVDQAWSAARRQLSKRARRLGKRLAELEDADFYKFFEGYPKGLGDVVPGMQQTAYCQTIDNWLKHFKSEQLQILFFDEIRTNPANFLHKVYEHIGVRAGFELDQELLNEPVNRNPEHPLPERFRAFLENRYRGEVEELERRFGQPIMRWREPDV